MNEQNIPDFSSDAVNQTSVNDSPEAIKQTVVNDVKLIENLVQMGAMTQEQGQNLMNYVTQKAFEKFTSCQDVPAQTAQQSPAQFPMPEFFNREGRLDVFDYLKSSYTDFDEDEISKISSLIEKIENTAIERYLRGKNHEKTLNSENETAKLRLRSNAQNRVSDGENNLVFTREQIGKMSGAEFAKHERAIMDQLKKGLIR